jgi:hypothetical protein
MTQGVSQELHFLYAYSGLTRLQGNTFLFEDSEELSHLLIQFLQGIGTQQDIINVPKQSRQVR